ncbi:MAG TPA: UDP-GlcNAc--UDP-phosphate GlcNAc-1-phosphate transferase [Cytophagales bacterium]|nr:UDP-GlcNAc--UDP-phosphate GlcNAc-1-phosphate transferase [Cytophagales bacterium]
MENSLLIRLGLSTAFLLVLELIYFKIADLYNIIDKPNERSSHVNPIIRGGGIIFVFAILLWYFATELWPWFVLATVMVAIISFLDDVTSLNVYVRFFFQFIALGLLFFQLWPLHWPFYFLVLAVPFCVGTINAFNFMDGINGITGVYSLVTIGSFWFINEQLHFTSNSLLMYSAMGVLVFLFFNFRKTARCFAGDVGSVTMALILIFIILQLINATGNFLWPLLLLVYGTDSLVTIFSRLKRKENILTPHRTHLYQYLSNELKISQRVVSVSYGIAQGILNVMIIYCLINSKNSWALVISIIFVLIYFFVRRSVMIKIKATTSL